MNKLKILSDGLKAIQQSHNDRQTLDKGLRILSPSGTNIIEFGSGLEQAYINTLSDILEDESDWVSWYIYDNDFGRKKLKAEYNGKMTVINTPAKLLKLIGSK